MHRWAREEFETDDPKDKAVGSADDAGVKAELKAAKKALADSKKRNGELNRAIKKAKQNAKGKGKKGKPKGKGKKEEEDADNDED